MSERIRLDKWLWQARFFKTRALAAQAIEAGGVRLNGRPATKAHQLVAAEDHLTLPLGPRVLALRVLALGRRRGPAEEARRLYAEIPATNPPEVKG